MLYFWTGYGALHDLHYVYMVLIGFNSFIRVTPMHYNSPEEVVHFFKVTAKLAK